MTAITRIDGWSVTIDADEPWISDEELGAKLGFSEARFIRKLIRSLLKRKFLSGSEVRAVASQTSAKGGRPGIAYLLNETGALLVILRSDTKIAHLITRQIVEVCKVARLRGRVPAPPPVHQHAPGPGEVSVRQNSPTLGDPLYRPRVERLCRRVVQRTGASIHRVQGWVRSKYDASGIYRILGVHFAEVRRRLRALAAGRLALPSSAPRRLKSVAEPPQLYLPGLEVRR
jgi:hypothetical protein